MAELNRATFDNDYSQDATADGSRYGWRRGALALTAGFLTLNSCTASCNSKGANVHTNGEGRAVAVSHVDMSSIPEAVPVLHHESSTTIVSPDFAVK